MAKGKVPPQFLKKTAKKGDEGLPLVPPSKRKPGTGDEGLPLRKGGKGRGDEGRPLKRGKQ